MDATVPTQIGRYVIDRLIGSGAMGQVFLGRDPKLDRPVAIKTLRSLSMADDVRATFLDRFRNEARAAARLHHPSIVQVYDVGEDEQSGPYLVFEYVAGSSLKQVLAARGPLPPDEVVRVAEQVADALDAAHGAGIIHRDIKPDNLLVASDGRIKLADFGVARVPDAALTREGQFLGTPCYAAPETLKNASYGPHSDLFSFAAVLYEVVTGSRAFTGEEAVTVAHKVIHDDPPSLREAARPGATVPAAVEQVVLRALTKNPDARPPNAVALAASLRQAYQESGLVASRASGAPPRGRMSDAPGAGSSWATAAIVVGGLLVGTALVLAFGTGVHSSDVEDDAATGAELDASGEAPRPPNTPPPANHPPVEDAGGALLQATAEDAGPPPVEPIGQVCDDSVRGGRREDIAKDNVRLARERLGAGDFAAARRLVDQARACDPTMGDLASIEAQLPADVPRATP